MGVTVNHLHTLREWATGGSTVTLRFKCDTRCSYVRKAVRHVREEPKVKVETSFVGIKLPSLTHTVVTTVEDFFWSYDCRWVLEAYRGTGREDGQILSILARTSLQELRNTSETNAPYPSRDTEISTSLTWLLLQLTGELNTNVRIDRSKPLCHTPRRNDVVKMALQFGKDLFNWAVKLRHYLTQSLLPIRRHSSDVWVDDYVCKTALDSQDIFIPVILFEKSSIASDLVQPPAYTAALPTDHVVSVAASVRPSASVLMDLGSINDLLAESYAGLHGKCLVVDAELAPGGSSALITSTEGRFLVACHYLQRVAQWASDGVEYVEDLLRKQVIAAVGKVLTADDFNTYMRTHGRRLFLPDFQPRPLCVSVRRSSQHTPEGLLRIEGKASTEGGLPEPILTISASVRGASAHIMDLAISAETRVRFGGERHLHAWLSHRFSDNGVSNQLSLVASARQFSSFILLVGRISSATTFEPLSAIIVKDKDDITIPLSLSEIPTPKEFKDAIASLSPEQQRFAKAFRAMQLESTLFGVLVLHIKPQLELLLKLAPDSLTKEIELTQDLMNMFIKYQIPADLLSFGGSDDAGGAERLVAVKHHVAAVKVSILGLYYSWVRGSTIPGYDDISCSKSEDILFRCTNIY